MVTMTKTNEQYIETSYRCPSCDSIDITSVDDVETDSNSAWQNIECNSCKVTWQDVYKLTGYDNLTKP